MDETNTGGTPPNTAPADAGAKTEAAAPSHGDWNAMAKNIRETKAEIATFKALADSLLSKLSGAGQTPAPVVKPADPPKGDTAVVNTQMAELLAAQKFNDVLLDSEIPLTREQKDLLRTLYKAESPPDVGAWFESRVTVIGARKVEKTESKTETAPVKPVGAGAPAAGWRPGQDLPLNPNQWPQSAIDAATPEQMRAAFDKWVKSSGQFQHPFAAARRAEEAAGDTSEAARQIAEVLKRVSSK